MQFNFIVFFSLFLVEAKGNGNYRFYALFYIKNITAIEFLHLHIKLQQTAATVVLNF